MSRPSTSDLEIFEEELAINMKTLEDNIELIEDPKDRKFAASLCTYYINNYELTERQKPYACQFWQEVNALGAKQAEPSRGTYTQKKQE